MYVVTSPLFFFKLIISVSSGKRIVPPVETRSTGVHVFGTFFSLIRSTRPVGCASLVCAC